MNDLMLLPIIVVGLVMGCLTGHVIVYLVKVALDHLFDKGDH